MKCPAIEATNVLFRARGRGTVSSPFEAGLVSLDFPVEAAISAVSTPQAAQYETCRGKVKNVPIGLP